MASEKKALDFEDHRFTRVTKVVLEDETYLTKPVEKLVYSILCLYASNRTMTSHPSVNTIASKCLCSENTVRTALKRLEELELVGIERRRKGNRHHTSIYTLWIPPRWFYKSDTSNGEVEYFNG